ncbi:MAG: ATP-binding cassette domain-containing protein [Halanaerobiaceae bacterium]|nr:ATP-binding cassette domain-containing protein [Halanaerobiaceae bacterium]
MIVCENLVKIYKIAEIEVFALQGLELRVKKGEMVGIIGSSGSGKSTLLNILGGLDTPTGGQVRVAGWNLNKMSYRDKIFYKRETVGFVWQNTGRNLLPHLTALENVRLPMILKGKKKTREWAEELLEAVGLSDRMDHYPLELSGGQQQRVAIAVALANRPQILLADEPTGSLDTKTGSEIFQVFKRVCRDYGITIIVVTHDRSLAGAVDRAVEIRDGKISTESVRNRDIDYQDLARGLDDDNSHSKYVVVDSAGRLQLPEEYRKKLGIRDKAVLEMDEDRIVISPPDEGMNNN